MAERKSASDAGKLVSRRRRWSRRLMAMSVGLFVGFLVAEGMLRLAGFSCPRRFQPDENLGWTFRPEITFVHSTEGRATCTTNRDGFRDDEHALAKPPGVLRIAVLGDSYVEAVQVAKQDRLTEVLAEQLKGTGGLGASGIEILNFGISGYGTAQALQAFRHRASKYAPDIVVLCLLTGNDLCNNSIPLDSHRASHFLSNGRPFFILDGGQLQYDDSLVAADTRQKSWSQRTLIAALDHLRTVQLAYRAYQGVKTRRAVASNDEPRNTEIGLDDAVYTRPTDADWNEAWKVTEALIAQFQNEVEQAGAKFLVVTLTNGIQVHPDAATRAEYAKWLKVDDLTYPDRRIKEFCDNNSIAVLTLVDAFQRYAEQHEKYLHGFENTRMGIGHWNETGHRLAGEQIAREIVRRFGKPEPSRTAPEVQTAGSASKRGS
jgi:hypothetical protein